MQTDGLEVLALPDNPGNGKVGSDIIERISNRRKVRHDQAVQDMYNVLAAIAKELEVKVQDAGQHLKTRLAASRCATEDVLGELSNDEKLMAHSLGGLHQIWVKVEASTNAERDLIRHFEKSLRQMEVERCDKVTNLLQTCQEQLERIAFFLRPDVDEFISQEAETINEAMQNNHHTLTTLCGRLHLECIEKELAHHAVYSKLEVRWKTLHCDRIFADFQDFMKSSEVTQPEEVSKVMVSLQKEQEEIILNASKHLHSLGTLEPPACTKNAVRLWNREMQSLLSKLASVHQQSLAALQESQVAATDNCVTKMENLQACLVNEGYCSEDEVIELMNQCYLPHVEQRQEEADRMIQSVEFSLKHVMSTLCNQVKETFELALGAGNQWDCHQAQLQTSYRTWQESHDNHRKTHLATIQQAEAKLSETMTLLREGHNQKALDDFMSSAANQLSLLWDCYELFRSEGCLLAATYTPLVESQVLQYETDIFGYFSAVRSLPEPPSGSKKLPKTGGRTSRMPVSGRETGLGDRISNGRSTAGGRETSRGRKTRLDVRAGGPDQYSVMPDPSGYRPLHLPCGTTVYIVPRPRSTQGKKTKVFVTEEAEEDLLSERYVDQLMLFTEASQSAQDSLRVGCLNHVCTYQEKAMKDAQEVVTAKVEEYETEIVLKKTVHNPRLARIKRDIHNVRAAEVIQHEQRVQSHIATVFETVTVQQQRLRAIKAHTQDETDEFTHHLSELTTMLSGSHSLSMLASVEKKAQESLEKHVASVKSEIDSLYRSVEEVFDNMKRSTDDLRNSFRLFADGGNFCYDEMLHLNADLENLDVKVMSAENLLLHDLTNLEQSLCRRANEILAKFQESYWLHEADMQFLEKVTQLLTRVQICIKTEVANSNKQTADLVDALKEVETFCDNLQETPECPLTASALQHVKHLAELCRARTDYLDCLADSVKTVHRKDQRARDSSEPISAINVTRSILRRQNSSPQKPSFPRLSRGSRARRSGSSAKLPEVRSIITSGSERSKSRFERGKSRADESQLNHSSFLPRIYKILKQGQDGVNSVCEAYYVNKGSRVPLWPESIAATLEASCDSAAVKLQSYGEQAEEYHNNCLLEFHSLLENVLQCVCRLVPLVMSSHVKADHKMLSQQLQKLSSGHKEQCQQFEDAKEVNYKQLQPYLSHPSRVHELEALGKTEGERQLAAGAYYDKWPAVLQSGAKEYCLVFFESLTSITKSVFTVSDGLLTAADIVTGKLPPVHKTVIQMLREQQNPTFNHEEERSVSVTGQIKSVSGLPVDDLLRQWCPDCCDELSKKIVCSQLTAAHQAAIASRDDLFQNVLQELHQAADQAEQDKSEKIKSLQRWSKHWKEAVQQRM